MAFKRNFDKKSVVSWFRGFENFNLKVVLLKPGVSFEVETGETEAPNPKRIPKVFIDAPFSFKFWYPQKGEIDRFNVDVSLKTDI